MIQFQRGTSRRNTAIKWKGTFETTKEKDKKRTKSIFSFVGWGSFVSEKFSFNFKEIESDSLQLGNELEIFDSNWDAIATLQMLSSQQS